MKNASRSPVNPRDFWQQKILDWEKGRYFDPKSSPGLLERIADWSSRSLRFRLKLTQETLRPFVPGKKILELGCGSGLITKDFMDAGAQSYLGLDIAAIAIENAKSLAQKQGLGKNVRYEAADLSTFFKSPDFIPDVTLSLGLLDWLTDDELERVFAVSALGGEGHFFHAISEKRFSLSQCLHKSYVYLAYGYKTGSYIPRYYRVEEIKLLARRHTSKPLYVLRNPLLSFGAIVTTLAVKGAQALLP